MINPIKHFKASCEQVTPQVHQSRAI